MKNWFIVTALIILLFSSCAFISGGALKKELAFNYLELADAYATIGQYDKAITFYEKAAKHEEYTNITQYSLARMYALTGKWDKASSMLEPLDFQEPNNRMISTAYAFALVSSGELDTAQTIYEKNYRDNSENPVAARNYAEILFIAKRYDDALALIVTLREQFVDVEPLVDIDELEKMIIEAKDKKAIEAEKPAAKDSKKDDKATDVKAIPEQLESAEKK